MGYAAGLKDCHDCFADRAAIVLYDALTAVTEQRDRLADALERIVNNNIQDAPETDYAYVLGRMEGIAKIALQYLKQNAEVRHGAKDADLD